ncbi:hypothetical protein HWN39_10530 [Lactobacillus rhamnosus]|uniref:Uncharacterized protein n=1 Tax=Lacticaseibacillus rhamnosus TaxID=47715 RepID=A0A7Y7UJA5_LACRH|nr:hypothetical protein [Lacticaseibacillus rhamnosus]NVO88914.1 hypothetical protein [Lacticaseibacillus rhamnosus]
MGGQSLSILLSSLTALSAIGTLAYNIYTNKKHNLYLQASKVSCWLNDYDFSKFSVTLSNTSSEPVYNVFVYGTSNARSNAEFLDTKGDIDPDDYEFVEVLPPGKQVVFLTNHGSAAGGEHSAAGIYFRDSKNVEWNRKPSGYLKRTHYLKTLSRKTILLKHL